MSDQVIQAMSLLTMFEHFRFRSPPGFRCVLRNHFLSTECLNWETLALFSGIIGNDYLAAEVIIINIGYFIFMFCYGFMSGIVILVG